MSIHIDHHEQDVEVKCGAYMHDERLCSEMEDMCKHTCVKCKTRFYSHKEIELVACLMPDYMCGVCRGVRNDRDYARAYDRE